MSRSKKKRKPGIPSLKPLALLPPVVEPEAMAVKEEPVVTPETSHDMVEEEPAPSVTSGNDPLVDEVQSYLRKKQELAQRLSNEIAATEQKLAELKKTAALLFPEKYPSSNGVKDRKVKKPKKVTSRAEATSPASEASESSAEG